MLKYSCILTQLYYYFLFHFNSLNNFLLARSNYLEFYERLFGAIRNGQPLTVNPEDALQVIRIIQTAHASSRERKVIDL